jgi:Ca2+-binding EF-hand superfamily protein
VVAYSVYGDVNGDGVVDIDDIFDVLAAWGPCDDPSNCPADVNGDGTVDIDDLFEVLANWT